MRRLQVNTSLEAVLPGPASLDVPVLWGSRRDCLSRIVTTEPGRGRAGSPFGAILREINLLVAPAYIG